ncbi:hypothetical protein [Halobacteriovorax sp. JY17]|uniref:hypothetical protein n=1 Tax=Halobacteriovorax sp. JY17 TaxID=2014617 RepID=UPI000C4C0787|nr:hypothetical protein [Halobacteriovorax sp. JY17]PIK14880.1 MAG: hypothetical protein CES88_11145 [Halobacteriovorax sp. JY17]
MKTLQKQAIGWAIITPFIISIIGWFQGWEITYRPIANAPIISPYTSLVFIILFVNKLILPNFSFSKTTYNYVSVISLGIITSVLFLELAIHAHKGREIFSFPISSISTILTFFLICIFEIMSNESEESNLVADAIFLLSLFWVYLSICGHIFGEIVLTGINNDTQIGLSLPTAISFLLYIGLLLKNDKIIYTKKLFNTVDWTKKYITLYLLGYLALPLFFIILLKNVQIQPEDHFKIFLSFSMLGLFFITLFIVLVHFLSRTHTGLQMICSYTKRIKTSDGKWVPIESYLHTNYGLEVKHETSPGGQQALAKHLKRE